MPINIFRSVIIQIVFDIFKLKKILCDKKYTLFNLHNVCVYKNTKLHLYLFYKHNVLYKLLLLFYFYFIFFKKEYWLVNKPIPSACLFAP